jgi:CBS domain-containing protein
MQLKDFINYRVEMIQPTDTLQEAAEKMRYLDVGSMPVCEGQHLIGVITDRDITIRATAKGQDPTKTEVREAMTADVVYCLETQQAEEAAKMMQEHQIRRIFVVNENDELVGVTSLGELATVTGDRALVGETLERISVPSESNPAPSEEHGEETGGESESDEPSGIDERR